MLLSDFVEAGPFSLLPILMAATLFFNGLRLADHWSFWNFDLATAAELALNPLLHLPYFTL